MIQTLAFFICILQKNGNETFIIPQSEHLSANAPSKPCMPTNS